MIVLQSNYSTFSNFQPMEIARSTFLVFFYPSQRNECKQGRPNTTPLFDSVCLSAPPRDPADSSVSPGENTCRLQPVHSCTVKMKGLISRVKHGYSPWQSAQNTDSFQQARSTAQGNGPQTITRGMAWWLACGTHHRWRLICIKRAGLAVITTLSLC